MNCYGHEKLWIGILKERNVFQWQVAKLREDLSRKRKLQFTLLSDQYFEIKECFSMLPVLKFWWRFCENQGCEHFVLVSCSFKANCKLCRLAFTWLDVMINIRVYLTGGEEKSSEKINTEIVHKRPNEEGKVPQSNERFCHHGRLTFHGYTIEMGQYSVQCE